MLILNKNNVKKIITNIICILYRNYLILMLLYTIYLLKLYHSELIYNSLSGQLSRFTGLLVADIGNIMEIAGNSIHIPYYSIKK
jgi:hypothetical protein